MSQKGILGDSGKDLASAFSGQIGIQVMVVPEGQFLKPNNYLVDTIESTDDIKTYQMNVKHKDLSNLDLFRKFSPKIRDNDNIEYEEFEQYCRKPLTKSSNFIPATIILLNASGLADDWVSYSCEFYDNKFLIFSLEGYKKLKSDIKEIMDAIKVRGELEAEIIRLEGLVEKYCHFEEINIKLEDHIEQLTSQINDQKGENANLTKELKASLIEFSQLEVKNQNLSQTNAELKAISDKHSIQTIEHKKMVFEHEKGNKLISEQKAKIDLLQSEGKSKIDLLQSEHKSKLDLLQSNNKDLDEQVTSISNRLKEELENVESLMSERNELEELVDSLKNENNTIASEAKNSKKQASLLQQEN